MAQAGTRACMNINKAPIGNVDAQKEKGAWAMTAQCGDVKYLIQLLEVVWGFDNMKSYFGFIDHRLHLCVG